MLHIVSAPSELQRYQGLLIQKLEKARPDKINCTISWRPESFRAEINWLASAGIWYYSQEMGNRWWNTFGIKHPIEEDTVGIACEINIPMFGINRNIAGGIAEEDDKVFLIHRGNRFGGGVKGMTKEYFWRHYTGVRRNAMDDNRLTEIAIVGELQSNRLTLDIASFVNWMVRLKGK